VTVLQLRKRVRFSQEAPELAQQVGELAIDLIKTVNAMLARDGTSGAMLASLRMGGFAIESALTATFGATPQQMETTSGRLTVDWSKGQKAKVLLSATPSRVQFLDPPGIGNFMLLIKQDSAGGRSITSWPASVKWAGGTPPTITVAANAVDVLAFYYDGSNYWGVASQDFS
jgi:hypothetical protein